MIGTQGLITLATQSTVASAEAEDEEENLHLAPGALWRRIETRPNDVALGEVIGEGAYSRVHRCTFMNRVAACKIFRNSSEESAFKEIEIMFSMRHPHIIGLYAWFQIKGWFFFLFLVTDGISLAQIKLQNKSSNMH